MREVEVLKRLDHPGIVKYLGMQRKRDNLNIALEYVLSLDFVCSVYVCVVAKPPPPFHTDTSRTVPWDKH